MAKEDLIEVEGTVVESLPNPAIAPRPSAVGGMVEQQRSGGRDVAPSGRSCRYHACLPRRARRRQGLCPWGSTRCFA